MIEKDPSLPIACIHPGIPCPEPKTIREGEESCIRGRIDHEICLLCGTIDKKIIR